MAPVPARAWPRRQGGIFARGLARFGEWLRLNQRAIGRAQWAIVALYIVLVAVPAFLPPPGRAAHIWSNLTVFAQFAFWGVWWPFVLLSMVVVGRSWCGIFCPEGALTETVSRHSLGLPVPRWIRWKGWPFTAFALTTIYGQMTSVYQYPKPVLLILGGSTGGAMLIGALYGRDKRVWCRYLCPVNGVFGLLAKLAPMHYRVDEEAWAAPREASDPAFPRSVTCAPLVPLKRMKGASDCHMCGRCSAFRGAIELAPRAPNHEVVEVAGATSKPWDTALITFGLMGIAAGAFHWSASPWYYEAKTVVAGWLIDHGLTWVLAIQPPWWILTDYPDNNDALSLLDGALLVGYILATAAAIGVAVSACLALATVALGRWRARTYHHLAQALIPIAGCGVFLGLFAITLSMLKADGIVVPAVGLIRGAMLAGAWGWVVALAWSITRGHASALPRRLAATLGMACAAGIGVASWVVLFYVWS
jgi:polyferredoxin